jgi:tricorn protease-like protein
VVAALGRAAASDTNPPPASPAPPATNAPSANASATNKSDQVVVKVDAEGLAQRIAVLPPPASNYGALTSVGDKLFYVRKGKLHVFDLDKEKETELGDVAGYRVSADKKKMLVRAGSDFAIVDLPSAKLDLGDRKALPRRSRR